MIDVNKIPDFTLESLAFGFLVLYAGLQFADPIFIVFELIADMILYIVMIGVAVMVTYVITMLVHSLCVTIVSNIRKWWRKRQEPSFNWVTEKELQE